MKVKRFIVMGVEITPECEDRRATEEGQFDFLWDAQQLLKKYNTNQRYTEGGLRYFILDMDPDPYTGNYN